MLEFEVLKKKIAEYLDPLYLPIIDQAYHMAFKAHEGQKRASGEPYISHPLAVADILADMHMDYQSIVAAILHDVIEDTTTDRTVIASHFGEEIAQLVESLSKLDQIKFENHIEAQAENLRKMMLAMTRDIRVILIKLADRLHNMRTLSALPREKQRRIARETLEIYAPIANRLGMNSFRLEFEENGFAHLYPIRYQVLKKAVQKARGHRKEIVSQLQTHLQSSLEKSGIASFRVMAREKHLYSLYKKMKQKDLSLSEIMDLYALRILVDTVDSCYRLLGVVHNCYKPMHGRFKDYIAVPKVNGYQSLHTVVLGPHGIPVEIQIRTEKMHHMAENGIAAHWLYKSPEGAIGEAEIDARHWVKGILEIQKNTKSSKEFIEDLKIDLYPDEVYVFTPDGDILSLPNDATAVDFAYAVHTDVGNACIAAKIDRRLMPLSTRLTSGQTVEIVISAGAHPNPAWLSFVVTGKARSNIRHFLKSQQTDQACLLGQRLIEQSLSALSLSLKDMSSQHLAEVLEGLQLENFQMLCAEVGMGNQAAPLVARRLIAELPLHSQQSVEHPLAIRGTEGMVVSYGKCCYPIPGDAVMGCLSSGRGLSIHRDNCERVRGMDESLEQLIAVQWSKKVEGEFKVELRVEVLNNHGILALLTHTLAQHHVNVESVHIDARDSRHSIITFLIGVYDRNHLIKVMKNLKSIEVVTRVTRGPVLIP